MKSFLEMLNRPEAPTPPPGNDEFSPLQDQIASASPAEIAEALPVMVAALRSSDTKPKRTGIFGLLSVSLRLDSPALLDGYLGALASILDFADAPQQRVGAVILECIVTRSPTPPDDAVKPLIGFLKRTDRDLQAQTGAIQVLVRAAPEDVRITEAVTAFLSRPLDAPSRVAALTAVTDPHLKDAKIISAVAASLADSDGAVRESAVKALVAMGPNAIAQAEPELLKVLDQPGQAESLRSAVKGALSRIGRKVE